MNKKKIAWNVLLLVVTLYTLNAQEYKGIMPTGPYLGQEPPGDIPQIFAPEIVSTSMYNHSSISISPDGNEIYWAMSPIDTPRRIYFTKRINNSWSEPKIIHFTQSEDGDCPVLSNDGMKMYFNSNRPINNGGTRRERIWCVDRVDGMWGSPYPLGMEINGQHLHWQVTVDMFGNIYFGSEREGSKGRDDIFYSEYSNGTYKTPVSIGTGINSGEHESTPFIDPNGEYLIVARNGLWISFRQNDEHWSEAVPMGVLLDGICPYVSPDGKFIFFLKMGMGYNDIYWVSANVIEKLKRK